MTNKEKLLEEALALTPKEKAEIIQELIQSMDHPDADIDELWKIEAESRIDAYEREELKTVSVEEAINKYKKK